jgi:hypothetical protein
VTRDEIATMLSDENPEALLADGFEDAFVGISRRCGQPTLAVYDCQRGVELLMQREGMTTEEAEEWMEFNVVGAWAGEQSPIWLVRVRK